MAADLSGISYFAPIFSFLLVLSVVYALLIKTKIIGESKPIILFISLVIATIFISFAGVREYVLSITAWISLLIISLFFILMLIGFLGKDAEFMTRKVGAAAIIIAGIIFLVSGFFVFSDVISSYLPFSYNYTGNLLTDFLYSPRFVGAVIILIAAALASRVLFKVKEKK